jgi:hypothetical protein
MKNINKYYEPTPAKWRKLGDGLLAVSTTLSTYAIAEDLKVLAITSVILGALAKFLTNFFSE